LTQVTTFPTNFKELYHVCRDRRVVPTPADEEVRMMMMIMMLLLLLLMVMMLLLRHDTTCMVALPPL
jgi:hypothetical protein